jgi:hypothetical protein
VIKLFPALTVLAACAVDLEDPELAATERLAANRLAANKLSAAALAASTTGDAPLTESALAATGDGREVLSYIVSCALPGGSTLRAGGQTFTGDLGLAPAWASRAPTIAERRWVTACVLARTNLYGTSVKLSLRGDHPALTGSLLETLDYTLLEGAFYGDLFDPTGPRLYACASELRDLRLDLATQGLRACAISDDGMRTGCGFTYTGKCAPLDLSLRPACNDLLPPYGHCRGGDERFTEVITVALETPILRWL